MTLLYCDLPRKPGCVYVKKTYECEDLFEVERLRAAHYEGEREVCPACGRYKVGSTILVNR